MEFNHNSEKYSKDYFDKIISENEDIIKKLNSELSEKNIILTRTKSYLFDLEFELNKAKNKINSLEADLAKKDIEIKSKNSEIQNINSQIENNKTEINSKNSEIQNINSQIENNKTEINNLLNQINSLEKELNQKNNSLNNQKEAFNFMEKRYIQQSSKLDTKKYCISCYEEKINNDALEIKYLKKNGLIKKFLNPFTYLYLVFKSKPHEISINLKLHKALKNSKCFDIGYYLNNNKDLVESSWCKYFSPELHYICKGFDEGRRFNKKYYNKNSKKELLDYISKCS